MIIKRAKNLIMLLVFILVLVGCNQEINNNNKINYSKLSDEEKSIINLLSSSSEIDIFDFEIDDTYTSVSVWIEIYENGVLKSDSGIFKSSISDSIGKLALVLDKELNSEWMVSYSSGGSTSSNKLQVENDLLSDNQYSRATTLLTEEIEIDKSDEIVLKAYMYQKGGSTSVYNAQHYVEDKEVLKEYDYIILVKAKFNVDTE